jgi:hypothetical protein
MKHALLFATVFIVQAQTDKPPEEETTKFMTNTLIFT